MFVGAVSALGRVVPLDDAPQITNAWDVASSSVAVAMILTIVGVYGAMSYAVHLRHREVAIRIALGAHPAEVYRRVLRDGLNPVWMGLAFGSAGIWAIHRILAGFQFRVEPGDSLTILAATRTLIAAVIAAIAPSARTASRTDPSELLRID